MVQTRKQNNLNFVLSGFRVFVMKQFFASRRPFVNIKNLKRA